VCTAARIMQAVIRKSEESRLS